MMFPPIAEKQGGKRDNMRRNVEVRRFDVIFTFVRVLRKKLLVPRGVNR